MRTVKIDRTTWLRGGKNLEVPNPDYHGEMDEGVDDSEQPEFLYDESMLLREDGLMCCIGQACAQLGVPKEQLLGVVNVADLSGNHPLSVPAEFASTDSVNGHLIEARLNQAYSVNDDKDTTDEEKETELVRLFAKMNLQAEFIN